MVLTEASERVLPTLDPAEAGELAGLAAGLLAKQFPGDAELLLRFALTLDGGCFAARFALGEALEQQGRAEDAAAEYWQALAVAQDPSLRLLATDEEKAARRALADPVRDCPDPMALAGALSLAVTQRARSAALLALVGRAWNAAGRPAEAAVWFRRAAAIEPGYASDRQRAVAGCAALPELRLTGIDDSPELRDALCRLPLPPARKIAVEKLAGGVQNTVARLRINGRQFALRLEKFPSEGWQFYAEEAINAELACAAGVAPAILYFDRADGTELTAFHDGATMSLARFSDPTKAAAAGSLYRRLHAVEGFRGSYDILRMIGDDGVTRSGFNLAEIEDLAAIESQYEHLRALLVASMPPLAATHNDPIPENFIDGAEGLVLLDWQCAARADPHWEIGAFSAQAALPDAADQAFLAAYFAPEDKIGRARALLYKPVCSFFWLGRALIRGSRQDSGDWTAEALQSAQRFRELMQEPQTLEALSVLQASTSSQSS